MYSYGEGFPFLREAFLFGNSLYIWGMQWEYTTLLDSDKGTSWTKINEMGLQGWEMFFVLDTTNDRVYYFKRKVS